MSTVMRTIQPDIQVEPGDIVTSTAAGPLSKPIQWVAGTPTHAEIYLGRLGGVDLTVGAGPVFGILSKVRIIHSGVMRTFDVWRVRDTTEADRAKVIEFVMSQLGKPYSYWLLPILAYRIASGTLNKNIDDPYPNSYVCSELVAYAYEQVGIKFASSPTNTLPKTIVDSPWTTHIATGTFS